VIPASPFSRTCQASHLLSLILSHINESHTDPEFHYQQAIRIHHTISAFNSAISSQVRGSADNTFDSVLPVSLFTGMAICYSAQLTLYDTYTCAEADNKGGVGILEQLEMQNIALVTIKEVSAAVHGFANRIVNAADSEGLSRLSPLASQCLYQAARNYSWYIRETGSVEFNQALLDITSALRILGGKWGVASKPIYLSGNFSPRRVINSYL
jgi:hypothetical protein